MKHCCHANGCRAEAHPAMPFCKRHAGMLPEPHKKRLWEERRRDQDMNPCAACDPKLSDEARLRRSDDWDLLYHLAIAMLLLREYGDTTEVGRCGCGAPEALTDETGFCWGCGILGAPKVYKTARRALQKYNLSVAT